MDGTTLNIKIAYADNGVVVKCNGTSLWVYETDRIKGEKRLFKFLGECIWDEINESEEFNNTVRERHTETGEVCVGAEVAITVKPIYSKNENNITL